MGAAGFRILSLRRLERGGRSLRLAAFSPESRAHHHRDGSGFQSIGPPQEASPCQLPLNDTASMRRRRLRFRTRRVGAGWSSTRLSLRASATRSPPHSWLAFAGYSARRTNAASAAIRGDFPQSAPSAVHSTKDSHHLTLSSADKGPMTRGVCCHLSAVTAQQSRAPRRGLYS